MTFVYLIQMRDSHYYKVGITNNIKARMHTLQSGNPFELLLRNSIVCNTRKEARQIEKYLLKQFKEYSEKGEWVFSSTIPKRFKEYKQDRVLSLCSAH